MTENNKLFAFNGELISLNDVKRIYRYHKIIYIERFSTDNELQFIFEKEKFAKDGMLYLIRHLAE